MTDTFTTPTADAPGRRAATAFFDSREAAEKARADLIAAGIAADAVSIAGDDPAVVTAQRAADRDAPILPEDGGFWHALKEFFMPDEDRYTYAEGLRRGGVVVSVQTPPADYDRVLDILDADGAVDIDAREQAWKMEGWAGWQEGLDPLGGGLARPDSSTAGFGASYAGEDGYQTPPAPPPAPHRLADTANVTATADPDAESRGDAGRVGTGPGEPGALNPDMRERIGSGTASMTPPTPTGPQDATLADNAVEGKAAIEDASLGSPTRSGWETPQTTSTLGDPDTAPSAWDSRRDDTVRRARVRGFILDPRSP
jgi:hypothetical protein